MLLFLALLRRLLTNQEMIMDQLKILTLTLQKIQGERVGGQEVLEEDLFPLTDINSLLALERRVREEADFKKKMVTRTEVSNLWHSCHIWHGAA